MTEQPPTDATPGSRRHCLEFTDQEIEDLANDLSGGHSVSPASRRLLQFVLEARRRPRTQPVPTPPRTQATPAPAADPDDILHAPAQSVRPAPDKNPEMYWIYRKQDVTGISGVGFIGICFVSPDGAAAERWFGGPPQDQPKWEFYDKPGTAPFEQISGHTGNTVLIPIHAEPEPGT